MLLLLKIVSELVNLNLIKITASRDTQGARCKGAYRFLQGGEGQGFLRLSLP